MLRISRWNTSNMILTSLSSFMHKNIRKHKTRIFFPVGRGEVVKLKKVVQGVSEVEVKMAFGKT